VGIAKYDTVIVGAGSAGSVLAARLSEDPARTVCLVEAGENPDLDALPDPLRLSSMVDERHESWLWHHTARATVLRPSLAIPSGRVIGGSSAINTTVYLWALREDLDGWAELAGPEWRYEACVPFFQRIESDLDFPRPPHGTDGPIPVRRPPRSSWSPAALAYEQACLAAGYPAAPDHNAPDANGIGPVPFNTRDGHRISAAVAFLTPARSRPNLRIESRALVRRIVMSGARARGIEAVRDGERFVIEADEVILSAGAIGSPQLLLLSGVGPRPRSSHSASRPWRTCAALDATSATIRSPRSRGAPRSVTRTRRSSHPVADPIALHGPGSSYTNDACLGAAVLTNRTPDHEPRIGVSALLMHAVSAGELRLASADPEVQPAIDLGFFREPDDLRRMRAMIALAMELGSRPELAPLRASRAMPEDAALASPGAMDEWLQRNVLTSHHPCGTARMGSASDRDAVVDAAGRVHGVEGLRVVDASIMPDCPRVNINATTMMVAEKIAAGMRAGTTPTAAAVRAPA
jgi:choline dehydrogenase